MSTIYQNAIQWTSGYKTEREFGTSLPLCSKKGQVA